MNDTKRKSFCDKLARAFLRTDTMEKPIKEACRMAFHYIILGIAWNLITDLMTEGYIKDKHLMTIVSIINGWVFVFMSGIIIFILGNVSLKSIQLEKRKLNQSLEILHSAYEELETSHEELIASEEELRQQYDTLMENQRRLAESEERYRLVSEATNDGIWDESGEIRYFSRRWYEITGFCREEVEQLEDWKMLIHPEDYDAAISCMDYHLQNATPYYSCEYRMMTKAGKYIWIQTRGKALFDNNNKPYRIAGSHTDITELKEYQSRLHRMAYYDYLTALPNRQSLYETDFVSNPHQKSALLFIDVDNFKYINDTRGHNYGDQIIVALSVRLKANLQSTHSIFRFGGDEFVLIMKNISGAEEVEKLTETLFAAFKEPFKIKDSMIHANISIGAALYPNHGETVNELLRCADIAMYQAKDAGGNQFMLYDQAMHEFILERMEIERLLYSALEKNEFQLFYQPQVDLTENRIACFEALLRWNSSELGFVSPLRFIHIAEENQFIIPLGSWVLKEACAFLRRTHDLGYTEISVAVNISVLQIVQDDFVELVLGMLERYRLEPHSLVLEITETMLIESYDLVEHKLSRLNEYGVKISLDDFGKGYSSLSHLKQLPISILKIDKSFIDYVSVDLRSGKLTGQIIKLGKSLGLCVVAEGVETEEQLNYLISNQCYNIQGFYFSKPLPEDMAVKLISTM